MGISFVVEGSIKTRLMDNHQEGWHYAATRHWVSAANMSEGCPYSAEVHWCPLCVQHYDRIWKHSVGEIWPCLPEACSPPGNSKEYAKFWWWSRGGSFETKLESISMSDACSWELTTIWLCFFRGFGLMLHGVCNGKKWEKSLSITFTKSNLHNHLM